MGQDKSGFSTAIAANVFQRHDYSVSVGNERHDRRNDLENREPKRPPKTSKWHIFNFKLVFETPPLESWEFRYLPIATARFSLS